MHFIYLGSIIIAASTITQPPIAEPSSALPELVKTTPIGPKISTKSEPNRRQYQLRRIEGFDGYGFSVNSNEAGYIAHKITQIKPKSPAAVQGK
jgi:hypothetical protein